MTLEVNRKEVDELKEKYLKNEHWVQYLFNRFHDRFWSDEEQITAMREVLFEQTGVKVVKPGSKQIVVKGIDSSGRRSRETYGGVPSQEFDWSKYEK